MFFEWTVLWVMLDGRSPLQCPDTDNYLLVPKMVP